METAWWLVGGWTLFAASHMGFSSLRWRPKLVARLGAGPFLGLYSLVALGIFVPLVSVYIANRHSGPYIGTLAGVPGMRWLMYIGMGAALTLMVGGLLRSSPASVVPGAAGTGGVYQVTRHPLLMSFGLFGLLHLLVVSVHASELAFFAGFPLFVLVGTWHQDRRKLATGGEVFQHFHAQTPFLPFSRPSGIVAVLREQPFAVVLGVVLAVALRWLHPAMFGTA